MTEVNRKVKYGHKRKITKKDNFLLRESKF